MSNFRFETVGLTTPGKRLYHLRYNLCPNRKEFSQQHNISPHSLSAWETGLKPLTEKAAKRFVEIFGKAGILCTVEWLLYGEGHSPTSLQEFTSSLQPLEIIDVPIASSFKATTEVSLFIKNHPHSKVFKMEDDSMEPVFYEGDLLGGVLKEPDQPKAFVDKPCVIITEEDLSYIRFPIATRIKNHYNLVALNAKTQCLNPVQFSVKPKEIYKVIWIRREDSD